MSTWSIPAFSLRYWLTNCPSIPPNNYRSENYKTSDELQKKKGLPVKVLLDSNWQLCLRWEKQKLTKNGTSNLYSSVSVALRWWNDRKRVSIQKKCALCGNVSKKANFHLIKSCCIYEDKHTILFPNEVFHQTV